jgi:polysaccharide export outer membrane protein
MELPMTRNNPRRWGIPRPLLLVICFGIAIAGLAQADSSATAQSVPSQAVVSQTSGQPQLVPTSATTVISAGDQVDVEVFDTSELSGTVRVSTTGEINLPVLGGVEVAGLTTNEAARKIEAQLKSKGILIDPHVTVAVTEYASQGATVTGEVHAPGVYPTLAGRRLLDMIALAGGVSPSAGRVATIIHRNDPQHPHDVLLVANNDKLGAQENPVIYADDTVVIDKAGIIYIMGDVGRSGGYLIDNNEHLSLLQALTLAGGWTKTSAQSKVILIRKVPQGREEIKLDVSHVVHGEQADIKVANGDIVYVPSSIGKIFAYQGISAAVQGAEQAIVYGTIYNH